jgi:hypothetical protein
METMTLQTIKHVNQLMALNDAPLVEALFATLLDRKADPDEIDFYVGQLRAGYGKAAMVADFGALPEARAAVAAVSGLHEHMKDQRKERRSLWRRAGRDRASQRQLNRLENSVGQLMLELAVLKRELRQRLSSADDAREAAAITAQPEPEPVGDPAVVDLSGESVAVRRIFREVAVGVAAADKHEAL